jgi:hypothetical protein
MPLKWVLTASLFAACAFAGETAESRIHLARETLQSVETQFGPDDPATAMAVHELALALELAGYHRQAEYYAGRSLVSLEAHFRTEDSRLVPALNVLAEAYAGQERNTQALGITMRAVRIGAAAGPVLRYGVA